MSQHIISKSIEINASAARVWQALTDPEQTKEYFFHCGVFSDWKPGSDITFKGHIFFFIPIEMHGKIIEAIPNKILKYSLKNKSDEHGSSSTVTDTLNEQDGKTTLAITDDVGDGEGAEKRMEKSEKGWDKVLNGLKEFVEHGRE